MTSSYLIQLRNWVSPFTTSFLQAITFLGNHNFLIPANLAFDFLLSIHKKTPVVFYQGSRGSPGGTIIDGPAQTIFQSPPSPGSLVRTRKRT